MSIIGIEPIGVVLQRQRNRNEARRQLRQLQQNPVNRLRAITRGGGLSGGARTLAPTPSPGEPGQPAQPATPGLTDFLPQDRALGDLTSTELIDVMREKRRELPFQSKLTLLRARRRAANREHRRGRVMERLGGEEATLGATV